MLESHRACANHLVQPWRSFSGVGAEDSRKIHWLNWGRLTEVKGKGGLGFRDLEAFNLAIYARKAGLEVVYR